jgi:hypothetical protein
MWGMPGSSGNPSAWNYRGQSAFSEPETQAIRDLVLSYDFRVMVDYHSYGQLTYHPWGYTREPCPDDLPMSAVTFRMREMIYQTSGSIYTDWWDWSGAYVVSGDSTDWGYGELGIYSFGIELRPVTVGQGGFVLPENQIIPTCEENLPVALYLISFAAADYGIENLTAGKTYSNIQLAINDADDGDEIVVKPGVYHENIEIIDKNLTLRSIDPNDPNVVEATVINIEDLYQGPMITLSGSRSVDCLLDGLTITGGRVGISCCDVSPTIRNCIVESNGTNVIEFWESCEPPTIIDCNILGQVAEVYPPTLVAYWKMDEAQGIIAYDSAADCNGTLIGDPVWQPNGGMVAGALEFDGINDYVSTPFVLNPTDGSFSVFAWVKGAAPGQVVISQQISQAAYQPTSSNWLSADTSTGKLTTELGSYYGRGGSGLLLSHTVITDGNWHRIGLVWDGLNRTLYIDDVAEAEDTPPSLKGEDYGLYIGAGKSLDATSFWSGLIDDVRIYNRAVGP